MTPTMGGSPGGGRVGWGAVGSLTSARLAHEGHDPARGQREAEVLEHREAGAAGVTGGQDRLSETRLPVPCRPLHPRRASLGGGARSPEGVTSAPTCRH